MSTFTPMHFPPLLFPFAAILITYPLIHFSPLTIIHQHSVVTGHIQSLTLFSGLFSKDVFVLCTEFLQNLKSGHLSLSPSLVMAVAMRVHKKQHSEEQVKLL